MEFKPAPKGATCCKCQRAIPEGEECYQKTLIIGNSSMKTIEEMLARGQASTAYMCGACAGS